MKDLRIIYVDDDNQVHLDPSGINEPIQGLEAAVQRIVVAILMTPGTVLDAPTWGGGAYRLVMAKHEGPQQTEEKAKSVIRQASRSLEQSEPQGSDFTVTNLAFESIDTSPELGYNIIVRAEFANADAQQLYIPSGTYGST
ncbi:MAG: hypothetical protein ABEN55_15315 [Bradymonadaceae bacterium]